MNRTYDARNRLATLTFPDGYGDQTWTYTPDGLPAQVVTSETNRDVTNAYTYDKRRLLVRESLTQSDWYTWTIGYGYDANAHLTSETLPEGTWTYAPDALGRPTRLALSGGGTYVSGVQYAPDGTLKQFTRANGIVRTVTKNTRLLPSRIVDVGGGVTPIDQRYTWDKDANPTAITDYGNSAQNRTMTYDALDRLAGMNAASMGGQYNYSYDVLDNLRTLAHVGGSTSTFNYDSKNRLASIVNTVSGTRSYAWDVQGNLVNSAGKVYQFSYGNRMVAVSATTSHRYDAWGRRVETYDAALQSAALSLYARDGRLVFRRASSAEAYEYHAFQYLGGKLAVVADYNHSDQSLIGVRYPHTDAQGTIVAYTNASRSILSRSVYDGWGGPRDNGNDDAPGYTGHMQDSLTGLTYMQQRYYDPTLARFISVDPVGVDPGTGGNFNRYWYAKDNPYRYTDPTGAIVEVALQNPSLLGDYQKMMTYLSSSPTFAHMLSQLKNSSQTYVIELGTHSGGSVIHSRYMQAQHVVLINPKLGMKIKSSGKIESPSLIGAHEIAHAYLQDKLGDQKFLQIFETPVLTKDGSAKPHDSAGEEKATNLERHVAHDLGAPVRNSYTDVKPGFVRTCSVTNSIICSN